MSGERVLLDEDFGRYEEGSLPDGWWVEGGEKVWVDGGRLRVKADPPGARDPGYVCTVWHRQPFAGNLRVEFDAQVIASSVNANNINFFLCYSDPKGVSLYETRGARADGGYGHYHNLNGYIFTFLNDADGEAGPAPNGGAQARFRMRRCPGFTLVDETYGHRCRRAVTYHAVITKRYGEISYAIDGQTYLRWTDPNPLAEGLIGLRTFRTDLWWNDIRVVALD
jgi:hypothetical protein